MMLGDAEERNTANPTTFEIPSRHERESVRIGNFVKLLFLPDHEQRGERMWVKVTQRKEGRYVGTLDNHPIVVMSLEHGDTVEFGPEHILDTHA